MNLIQFSNERWVVMNVIAGIGLIGMAIFHKGLYQFHTSFLLWVFFAVMFSTIYPLKKLREEKMALRKKKKEEPVEEPKEEIKATVDEDVHENVNHFQAKYGNITIENLLFAVFSEIRNTQKQNEAVIAALQQLNEQVE